MAAKGDSPKLSFGEVEAIDPFDFAQGRLSTTMAVPADGG